MIDTNIIQSLGAGSGIDTKSLVTQLTEIERMDPQARIDSQIEESKTQLSDYGVLKSALATLQDAATALTDKEAMFSKSASFTDSDALVPVELNTEVASGTYNFEVEEIAQSQALAFTAFSSPSDEVGEGTLTINFGTWTRDVSDAPTTFALNGDKESLSIDITSENNSLQGLRDAINDANVGVQASIVYDGAGYVLSLLADSGADNQLEVVVAESGGGTNDTDQVGLSRFAFNEAVAADTVNAGTTVFTGRESQLGRDAEIKMNGLTVYRESNSIDDIVDGLKIDVLKKAPGETISITVSDDKAFAEDSVRTFVDTYNAFYDAINSIYGYSEQENEDGSTEKVVGSLTNDSLTKSIISQIRTTLSAAIPGLSDTSFTSLTNVGIRTALDGTLEIDEDDFSAAFNDNFDSVQKLFGPQTDSDSAEIQINSFSDNTLAGSYEVEITTAPAKGYYNGGTIAASVTSAYPTFDSSLKDYSFTLNVDGTDTESLTLPDAVYTDSDEIAVALQSLINSDTNLSAINKRVSVAYDSINDRFDITSSTYGVNSKINVTVASSGMSDDLGFAVANGTPGIAVAGTVNGVSAFGSANVLLPALGDEGEGLAMIISESVALNTPSTVNFSRGAAGELESLLDEYLSSNGLISLREDNLGRDLTSLDDDQDRLDRRMTAYEERLTQQYINMESILNSLETSGSFLDNLINTLPFTSSNN